MSDDRADRMTDPMTDPMTELATSLRPDSRPVTVWRNPLGGQTLRLDGIGAYLKVAPASLPTSHLPHLEADRVRWIADRIAAPRVLGCGETDGLSWMLTATLPGTPASGQRWASDPVSLVRALGRGARDFHDRLADRVADCPWRWDIAHRLATGQDDDRAVRLAATAPAEDDLVVAHGDLCAPNVLLADDAVVCGWLDLGKLGVADRAADLGALQWSLEYNGHHHLHDDLLDAYGWTGDPARVQWYRDFYTVV